MNLELEIRESGSKSIYDHQSGITFDTLSQMQDHVRKERGRLEDEIGRLGRLRDAIDRVLKVARESDFKISEKQSDFQI